MSTMPMPRDQYAVMAMRPSSQRQPPQQSTVILPSSELAAALRTCQASRQHRRQLVRERLAACTGRGGAAGWVGGAQAPPALQAQDAAGQQEAPRHLSSAPACTAGERPPGAAPAAQQPAASGQQQQRHCAPPVGISTKQLRPASVSSTIARCCGRKPGLPNACGRRRAGRAAAAGRRVRGTCQRLQSPRLGPAQPSPPLPAEDAGLKTPWYPQTMPTMRFA